MKQTLQIGFVILLIVISCSYSFAQKNISVLDYIPEPNGPVTYITKDTATHTLYVAGDFTTVGGVTHTTGAFINNTDGQPIPGFPKIDGPVNTSIPDGNGGWYIGGDFTHVGDREQYDLTQIDSAGNVTDFFKGMKTDGYVNTICKNNSTLYVGGQFTTIGKNASKYCAVLDSYTGGSALNLEGFNGPIYCATGDGASGWYVGGIFSRAGGKLRNNLAHINSDGTIDDNWIPYVNDTVFALAYDAYRYCIWAGGTFNYYYMYNPVTMSWAQPEHLVAIDLNGGVRPSTFMVNGTVRCIFVAAPQMSQQYNGRHHEVLVGGNFHVYNYGWQAGSHLDLLSFDDNPSYPGTFIKTGFGSNFMIESGANSTGVRSIYIDANNPEKVFIGGDFYADNFHYNGHNAYVYNLIAVNRFSSQYYPWIPNPNGAVNSITSSWSGNINLYIGGDFTELGWPAYNVTGTRHHLFLINISNLSLDPWNPDVNNSVNSLSFNNWNLVAGGAFTSIDGQQRNHLATFNGLGALTTWNPGPDSVVHVVIADSVHVLACGQFGTFTGNSFHRNNLAAIDITSGQVDAWNPGTSLGELMDHQWYWNTSPYHYVSRFFVRGYSHYVSDLKTDGNSIYAVGYFTQVGGQPRNNLAKIDAITGSVSNWNPSSNGGVATILPTSTHVYLGGSFTTIGNVQRNSIASVTPDNGTVESWNPGTALPNFSSISRMLLKDNQLIAYGNFTTTNSIRQLAAIDTGNAAITSPITDTVSSIGSIALAGNYLYTGGNIKLTNSSSNSCDGITRYNVQTGERGNWITPVQGISTICPVGNKSFVGGSFNSIGGITRNYAMAINSATGEVLPWNPNPDSKPNVLFPYNGLLYAGGKFNAIGGQARKSIAALSASTGNATAWNPGNSSTDTIWALEARNNLLYAGGAFSSIGGATRSNLAAIDTSTGLATSWNPSCNGTITSLARYNSFLYAAGNFSSIGASNRTGYAEFDLQTGNLTSLVHPDISGLGPIIQRKVKLHQDSVIGFLSTIGIYQNNESVLNDPLNRSQIVKIYSGGGILYDKYPNLIGLSSEAGIRIQPFDFCNSMKGGNEITISSSDIYIPSLLTSAYHYLDNDYELDADQPVNSLWSDKDTSYVGGAFNYIGNQPQSKLAAVVVTNDTCLSRPVAPSLHLNGTSCYGDPLTLYASTFGGFSYEWNGPNGFYSTLRAPVIPSLNSSYEGLYTCTGSYHTGCKSKPGSIYVRVKGVPVKVTSNQPCPGGTLQLYTQAQPVAYSWTGPNGFTSSLQNPAVTNVQNANAGIYRLTATETGCPSQEDSVAVQFHFSAITSQPANSRVCIGSNAYFKVTAGGNDLSYQWQTYNNGWTNLTENTTYNGTKTPTLSVLADSTMFCKSFRCMISSGCYPTIISDSGALRVGIIYPSINIDTNSCSPGIQITSLSTLTLCTKDSLEIHYIYRGGIDCGTDSISAELSDASGSFAAAIVLGKKAFDLTGTMKVLIPCGTLTGSGYRVRMVLSKPTLTSADNGSNIAISDCIPALSISSNSPVCQGSMLMLTSSAQTNYNWYYSPASWLFSHLQNPSVTSASSGYYKLSVNWACGTKSDSTFVNIIPPPKIYGIVPDNGITGSQVNIYGTGFNPVIANNTLYMGTALASITSIPDTNHIIASAQVNATDAPLTLIDKQCALSANLPNQFFLTDPCPKPLNASTTYAAAVSFSLGSVTASNIHTAIGDLDGDGKLDIVVRNAGSGIVQIFHNTSTSGSINPSSFAAPVNLTGGTITGNEEIKLVDLDNDGKLDILCNNNQIGSSNIAIWRNISTPGTINASSFASPMLIGTSFPPSTALSIGDINQDGKVDFVVGDPSENAIAVFLNYSQPGSLNIVNNCFISTTSARPTKALALIDIDGDQFPDLIQLCSNGKVSVYKGGVSCTGFQPPIDFNTLGNPTTLAVADLDKDNKPDIIVGYGPASTGFSYFRNTTNYYSYPYITFATRTDVSTTAPVVRITTGDATGDAKTDLLFANNNNSNTGNTFTIYPNTSSAPTISFGTPVSFTCGTAPHMVSLADLDGSGTKDIVVSFIGTNSIQVFRNQTNPAILPVITAGGPTDFCTGGNVTLTCSVAASYLWSTGATTRSITVSNTGSYWVRANGCEISLSTQVNVRNYPASFSVSGGGSYCSASGTGVPVNLSGSQTGVKYQLLLNAVSSGSPLSGTGSALSFGNQLSAGTYTVVATTDSSTCSTTMTGNATLTINNSPAAFTISGGGIYCSPSQTSLHVTLNGSQTGVNYQLKQNGTISIGSPLSGTGSGLNFGSQDSGIYTIAATAGNGCELTMTGSATITRYTDPAIFNISGGGNFCSYPGSGVSVQLSSSQPGILYTLLRNGINQTSTGLTGTGGILSFSNITDTGVYNMRASNVTSGCYTFMNSNATVSMTQSTRFYRDYDLDGYGDQYNYIDTCASSIPGYIINGGDCNDSSNMVHPGVMEICDNGVDDNCDTYIDENCRIYLFLAVYIEGFYLGNGQMQAILYNNDQATYPSMACDSITIELHADTSPYDLIATANGLLDVYGNVIVQFPSSLMNGSYFIALRHRNSIETWSKDPVLFNSLVTSFDFTNQ